jgi:hypothetical protein
MCLPAHPADGDDLAEQAARRGGAERHNGGRLDDRALGLEPDLAALDLIRVRALVQPPLAAHLVLEMLDCVGDEGGVAGNAGVFQRLIEDPSGRPDEWLAGKVFLVARLLADQHEMRVPAALAGNGLRCMLVERAARALLLGLPQLAQRGDRGKHIEFELGFRLHGNAR